MYALIIYLLVFLTAMGRKDRDRKRNEAEANKDNRQPLPDSSIPVVSIPPSTTNQEAPKHKKAKSQHWIIFLTEWAGLTVLGVYAGFIMAGWRHGENSITPLAYILIAYLLGLFTAWRQKYKSREYLESIREQTERRATIKFWVEIAGAVLLAIYAGFTIAQWWQTKKQVDILQRSWIKLAEEKITLNHTPKFWASGGPDYPPTAPFSSTGIDIEHTFTLDNFGNLPARRYSMWLQVFYSENGTFNWVHDNWENETCKIATGNMYGVQQHEVPFVGRVVFPGHITQYLAGGGFAPNTIHQIRELYFGVCLIYEDISGIVHRTAALYCQMRPENEKDNPVKVLEKPEMWWRNPTTEFEVCDTDAD